MIPTDASPRNMREIITRFREHLRAVLGRAARTATTYAAVASSFLEFLGERGQPARQDADQFLARRLKSGDRPSVSTRNQALAAIRAFASFAVAEGCWKLDPTGSIPFLREPPRDPAVLTVFEVHRFFRALTEVSPLRYQSRDQAILALLFTLGLRVHELVGLNVDQLDLVSATLVSVRGKGGSIHDLPVEHTALALTQRWLHERTRLATATETALFVSRRGTRLSIRSIERLFERLRTHVGTKKKVTPHTARHTFVTTGSQRGAELTALADVARHRDINVTRRYLHLGGVERRRVVELLGVVIPRELAVELTGHGVGSGMLATGQGAESSAELSSIQQLSLLSALEKEPANDFLVDDHEPLDAAPSAISRRAALGEMRRTGTAHAGRRRAA